MPANKPNSNTQDDDLLVQILEELLQKNVNITAREVARLHPHIGHASTITRNPNRSEVLALYQTKQKEIRGHLGRLGKRSKESTAAELANKDLRIAELEKQVELLQSSHLAMIRAVGELGGMSKWMRFFENYKEARDLLYQMNVLPDAEISGIHDQKRLGTDSRK